MAKVMVFIDGTWLYCNTPRLGAAHGRPDFHFDFGKLPQVLGEQLSKELAQPVDIVRTHLFGSYAANCDPRDDEARQRRLDFFGRLKEDYHYEVEIYPINFSGRRLKKVDRDPADPFEPREKCVDISLATAMLYYAAIPHAYDIAVAVVGDQDFKPVLQSIRKLGKRVALVSIRNSCAPDLADPRDEARVKDFDPIWLDDLLDKVELKYHPHQLVCESPMHRGAREVWTTFHPRRGQQFFCEGCREMFTKHRHDIHRELLAATPPLPAPKSDEASVQEVPMEPAVANLLPAVVQGGPLLRGIVIKKVSERGFGFIQAADGRDYFFHLADLDPGLPFDDVREEMPVLFEVKREPTKERGGTAQGIRRMATETEMPV